MQKPLLDRAVIAMQHDIACAQPHTSTTLGSTIAITNPSCTSLEVKPTLPLIQTALNMRAQCMQCHKEQTK